MRHFRWPFHDNPPFGSGSASVLFTHYTITPCYLSPLPAYLMSRAYGRPSLVQGVKKTKGLADVKGLLRNSELNPVRTLFLDHRARAPAEESSSSSLL